VTITELRRAESARRSVLPDASASRSIGHTFVLDALRDAILSGSLPGGARLIQTEIAARFEVGTTPVREAIRDLVGSGLVQSDVHRGAVVRVLDSDELAEIYEIRKILETSLGDKIVENITEQELARAEDLLEEMDRTVAPATWAMLNRRFHAVLTAAARSPRLEAMVLGVADLATMTEVDAVHESPSLTIEADRAHRALLDAIRRKRPDQAREIVRRHLDGALAAVLRTRGEPVGEVAS
jgi:DNA-binding GntR family transcriptional regulator